MVRRRPPHCDYCGHAAELVTGEVIYPGRADLHGKKFWRCRSCKAHVGCHGPNPRLGFRGDEPLGRLATAELRAAKSAAHAAFDPLWKTGKRSRREAYTWLAGQLGIAKSACHVGMFDVAMCRRVVEVCKAAGIAPTGERKRTARELLDQAEAIDPGNRFVATLRERLTSRGYLTGGEMTALERVQPSVRVRALASSNAAAERAGVLIDGYGLDAPPPIEPSRLVGPGAARQYLADLQRWGRASGRVLVADPMAEDRDGAWEEVDLGF